MYPRWRPLRSKINLFCLQLEATPGLTAAAFCMLIPRYCDCGALFLRRSFLPLIVLDLSDMHKCSIPLLDKYPSSLLPCCANLGMYSLACLLKRGKAVTRI